MRHLLLERRPDPTLTFESFFPCKINAFPLELAKVVASQGGARAAYNPLYVYSEIGLGKTHLLSAIANEAGGRRALMVNTADLEVEYERATRLQRRAELRHFLVTADILLLDDIQLCESNDALQLEIFAILNHMIRDARATVIASDQPPTRLKGIESRLLSRIGAGVIVGLNIGDWGDRREILRAFIAPEVLRPEVIDYVAEQITDSIRRLRAAAKQLMALQATGAEVNLDLARAVVPKPEDIKMPSRPPEDSSASGSAHSPLADRYKQMLAGAESRQEQVLAIEIALRERLRQLRYQRGDAGQMDQLEQALSKLREGRLEEALRCMEP